LDYVLFFILRIASNVVFLNISVGLSNT